MSAAIPAWAVPGARVVCLADYWHGAGQPDPDPGAAPVRDRVYTVDETAVDPSGITWGVRLREIANGWFWEGALFRPVTDRPNDVARFVEAVTPPGTAPARTTPARSPDPVPA